MYLLSAISTLLFGKTSIGIITRYIRHLIAGGIGTLFYVGFLTYFVEIFSLHPVISATVAFLLLEIYIYIAYRIWVYSPSRGHTYSIPRYIIVTSIALLLNSSLMYLTVEILQLWYLWGLVFAALIVPLTNFLISYYWAFR